jgi:hypothetical protein
MRLNDQVTVSSIGDIVRPGGQSSGDKVIPVKFRPSVRTFNNTFIDSSGTYLTEVHSDGRIQVLGRDFNGNVINPASVNLTGITYFV